MAVHPVLAVFIRHGTHTLWHYTMVDDLPNIVRHGAIFSRQELQSRGIPFRSTHYYGDDEKERVLSGFVSCAAMPPWGMMGGETEEVAILGLDPAVVTTPGTCFCPGWSPKSVFRAAEIVTWTEPEHAEALYTGSGYATVAGAEVFVPAAVQLDLVHRIVFFERASVDRMLPQLRDVVREANVAIHHTIKVSADKWRFPRDWESQGPPWMRDTDGDDEPIF